jgi:hypothetical protein
MAAAPLERMRAPGVSDGVPVLTCQRPALYLVADVGALERGCAEDVLDDARRSPDRRRTPSGPVIALVRADARDVLFGESARDVPFGESARDVPFGERARDVLFGETESLQRRARRPDSQHRRRAVAQHRRRAVAQHRRRAVAQHRRRAVALVALAAGLVGGLTLPLAALGGSPATRFGSAAVAPGETVYVVRAGDTLWSIAWHFDHGGDPRPLAEALAAETGSAVVVPGERIAIP